MSPVRLDCALRPLPHLWMPIGELQTTGQLLRDNCVMRDQRLNGAERLRAALQDEVLHLCKT